MSARTHGTQGHFNRGNSGGISLCLESEALLGSISLDLFVVLLSSTTALLPIFARDCRSGRRTRCASLRPGAGCSRRLHLDHLPPLLHRPRILMFTRSPSSAARPLSSPLQPPPSLAALAVVGASTWSASSSGPPCCSWLPPLHEGQSQRRKFALCSTLPTSSANLRAESPHMVDGVRAVVAGGVERWPLPASRAFCFPGYRRIDQLTEDSLMRVQEEPSNVNLSLTRPISTCTVPIAPEVALHPPRINGAVSPTTNKSVSAQ